MKRSFCLALCALMLMMAFGAGTVLAATDEAKSETKSEIKAMLDAHDKAMAEKDINAVLKSFSDTDPVLMGTGPGELWVGKEEIKDAYSHFFKDFDKGKTKRECPFVMGGTKEDIAWVTAVCSYTEQRGKDETGFMLNVSAVLVKEKTGWKFQTFHFSNVVGADQMTETAQKE
ncbi:nuclear transport factor 2 family protein [Desulfovibrio inopinatus]|uniref:nuclear transport factor 2 family protein n=1 Tax=Desulfovibrio inopinatus TaxID=102109 RepID=UPI000404011E|nr:nuclear transport factor 2 family protein [Desulfovibrio inopinatus]